jgi:hypothetical protein
MSPSLETIREVRKWQFAKWRNRVSELTANEDDDFRSAPTRRRGREKKDEASTAPGLRIENHPRTF